MDIDGIAFWDRVSAIAMKMPGAEASTSYGTPAFKVKKKLFARLKEDGKTLAIFTLEREWWMHEDAKTFFITDHYINYPMMLISLERVTAKDLETLIKESWRLKAPRSIGNKE
ncbi:MAG TPA: MmcQ/YjbR family DNA-binding protein [Chitinophagaceae bacterium]|nr:MmcQ/YjbR family DNA-binding protein [Chitinophagaceae bacterium]